MPNPCDPLPDCTPVVCEPRVTNEPICCTPDPVVVEDCYAPLAIVDCPPAYDMSNPCGCVPCFTPDASDPLDEGIPLTPEAKSAVVAMLKAMQVMIGMTPYCGCEPIISTGNDVLHQNIQLRDDMNQLLYVDSAGDQTLAEFDPVTGLRNAPAVRECCNTNLQDSIFLTSGTDPYAHIQDFGAGIYEGLGTFDPTSNEYKRRVGEYFCCLMDRVEAAPVLVITP